jgi:hypothetical protein
MKNSSHSAFRRTGAQLLAPVAVLMTAGILIAVDLRKPARLAAASSNRIDTDGDGLVDRQERILGTLPSDPDTDQDGFTDTEELARRTSPIFSQSFPENGGLQTGMTARGERNGLHALIAVYLPDSNYQAVDLEIGLLTGNRLIHLPESLLLSNATIDFVPAANSKASIALVDFRFSRTWVDMTGHLTLFATVSRVGSGRILAADAINLVNFAGVVVLAMPDPNFIPISQISGQSPGNPGTIYKPLTGDNGDGFPTGWTPGEICYQNSQAVSINGAVVTHEVISAACETGWDGSCPPDCSASVGSTYATVDPVILVGG